MAEHLPVVAVSTVVRGARKGGEHGALWVVDLELGEARQAVVWTDEAIDFAGDGGDRGLRGICTHKGLLYVASAARVEIFDAQLRHLQSVEHPGLGQLHEMVVRQGHLWVVSTAYDAVLAMDLSTQAFTFGVQVRHTTNGVEALAFDPRRQTPARGDSLHLNSIALDGEDLVFSGTRSPTAFRIRDGELSEDRPMPSGTHNLLPTPWGWAFNDTARDQIVLEREGTVISLPVPRPPIHALTGLDIANGPLARPAFARGLWLDGDTLVGGSSPSTVTAWSIADREIRGSQVLSQDVRHAVHGIAPWPFDG